MRAIAIGPNAKLVHLALPVNFGKIAVIQAAVPAWLASLGRTSKMQASLFAMSASHVSQDLQGKTVGVIRKARARHVHPPPSSQLLATIRPYAHSVKHATLARSVLAVGVYRRVSARSVGLVGMRRSAQ